MKQLRDRVIKVLSKEGESLPMSKLAAAVYSPIPAVRKIIKSLIAEGIVTRTEKAKTDEIKYTRHVIDRIKKVVKSEFANILEETKASVSQFADLLKEKSQEQSI